MNSRRVSTSILQVMLNDNMCKDTGTLVCMYICLSARDSATRAMLSQLWEHWREHGPWPEVASLNLVNRTSLTAQVLYAGKETSVLCAFSCIDFDFGHLEYIFLAFISSNFMSV